MYGWECAFDFEGRGYRLFGPPLDAIPMKIKQHRTFWELMMLLQIRQLDRHGIYLDIGSNIGNHAVFFAEECPSTRVVCFEPNPRTLKYLRRNLGYNVNKPFIVIPEPVGEDGVEFGLSNNPRNTGASVLIPGKKGHTTRSLDTIMNELVASGEIPAEERVAVIKIDVEGHEPLVLEHGLRTLTKHRPAVIVECIENQGDELDVRERLLARSGHKNAGLIYLNVKDGTDPNYLFLHEDDPFWEKVL